MCIPKLLEKFLESQNFTTKFCRRKLSLAKSTKRTASTFYANMLLNGEKKFNLFHGDSKPKIQRKKYSAAVEQPYFNSETQWRFGGDGLALYVGEWSLETAICENKYESVCLFRNFEEQFGQIRNKLRSE